MPLGPALQAGRRGAGPLSSEAGTPSGAGPLSQRQSKEAVRRGRTLASGCTAKTQGMERGHAGADLVLASVLSALWDLVFPSVKWEKSTPVLTRPFGKTNRALSKMAPSTARESPSRQRGEASAAICWRLGETAFPEAAQALQKSAPQGAQAWPLQSHAGRHQRIRGGSEGDREQRK